MTARSSSSRSREEEEEEEEEEEGKHTRAVGEDPVYIPICVCE